MSTAFKKAAVIGTGMMGPGIAVTLALGGVEATILGRTAESAAKGLETARKQLDLLEREGLADGTWAREHVTASHDLETYAGSADIIIESAPENMAFKQDLFAELDRIARPDAVLASNTSGLSITEIAAKCTRPERVMTTHFWNPPHLMALVEIVLGARTDKDLALAVRDLLRRCGKVPVMVKKDTPGQLGNRLQMAVVREAVNIVAEGIADVEEVDTAARMGFGLRLPMYGVLEHQDIVGLDMALGILDYVSSDLYSQQRAPEYYRQLVAEGKLGAKSGAGFYDWSVKSADETRARRDAFILQVLKWQRERAANAQ